MKKKINSKKVLCLNEQTLFFCFFCIQSSTAVAYMASVYASSLSEDVSAFDANVSRVYEEEAQGKKGDCLLYLRFALVQP